MSISLPNTMGLSCTYQEKFRKPFKDGWLGGLKPEELLKLEVLLCQLGLTVMPVSLLLVASFAIC
jgi:hypothetical protein